MAFQTTGRACYQVEAVTPDHAESVGCPGADFRIFGRYGGVYGFFIATGSTPGAEVRVPGWTTARLGIRAQFVPAVLCEEDQPIDGYLALS